MATEWEHRIAALEAALQETTAELAAAQERIAELEGLLEQSRRAGKRQAAPFAKRGPKENPKRPGRKAGPDHGRHSHRRASGRFDRQLDAPVSERCGCGGHITLDGEAFQYVAEMPVAVPVTTRFRIQIGHCDNCGKRHQGQHPDQSSDALGAAGSQVGPRAKAMGLWLHYSLGLSFNKCSAVLAKLGISMTAGALSQTAQSTSKALQPAAEDLHGHINRSPVVTMDETGWHVGGHNHWLWAAATADATLYVIGPTRSFTDAQQLVDCEYQGTVVRDGWPAYRHYDKASHQSCVAHLLRRCEDMITDLPSEHRLVPTVVATVLRQALSSRDLPAPQRQAVATDLAKRLEKFCSQDPQHPVNKRLIKHLSGEHSRNGLFTFLTHEGVDATNWRAEQAIRPAVVNRKVWGGNRTPVGAATQSRLMSVIRTAAQRRIDPLQILANPARAPNLLFG